VIEIMTFHEIKLSKKFNLRKEKVKKEIFLFLKTGVILNLVLTKFILGDSISM